MANPNLKYQNMHLLLIGLVLLTLITNLDDFEASLLVCEFTTNSLEFQVYALLVNSCLQLATKTAYWLHFKTLSHHSA